MATLNLKYITQKKYEALTEEEKKALGYIYFTKASTGYGNYNAIYTNGRCFGAFPNGGAPLGYCKVDTVAELPAMGQEETMYVLKDGTIFFWDSDNLKYVSPEGNWDIICGGDSTE